MRHFILGVILIVTNLQTVVCQSSKIDAKLLSIPKNESQNIVVILNEQADIIKVKTLKGKDIKANFVYKQLYETSKNGQKEISDLLNSKGKAFRRFFIVNMVSFSADLDLMLEIAALPSVKSILRDGNFMMHEPIEERTVAQSRAIEWNVSKINAPEVWALGYNGQNVVVGGQDTGYKWDHNALIDQYRGWNGTIVDHDYNWHDAILADNPMSSGNNSCGFNSPVPCDDNGHGTHTMGTMVGDDGGNYKIGVAPGAKWIACRNMENGYGTLTTYVECFQWFLAPTPVGGGTPDVTKMPHVINNSWGCPPVEGCDSSNFAVMETALNNLRSAGCVIVVSAGNYYAGCSTVRDPAAIFEGSFSVGSTTSIDEISNFSSRGPVAIDSSNRLKPNISAPGSGILSSLRNGGYGLLSGTSMAGPHVAGLVALLISANPELAGEVDKIEDIIEQTAQHLTSAQTCGSVPGTNIPNNTFGYGRIDALAAVNIALADNYDPYVKQASSIVVSNSQRGLILVSQNNSQYRVRVNDLGQLTVTLIGAHGVNSMLVNEGSLKMETSNAKIILRSPNNTYWQLNIDNNSQLSTQTIQILPQHFEINTGDLKISAAQKGVLLRSPDNTCYLTNISNLGQILTIPADCLN
jgi:subtilisin family serine protease